jgi:hypothetical protein
MKTDIYVATAGPVTAGRHHSGHVHTQARRPSHISGHMSQYSAKAPTLGEVRMRQIKVLTNVVNGTPRGQGRRGSCCKVSGHTQPVKLNSPCDPGSCQRRHRGSGCENLTLTGHPAAPQVPNRTTCLTHTGHQGSQHRGQLNMNTSLKTVSGLAYGCNNGRKLNSQTHQRASSCSQPATASTTLKQTQARGQARL